MQRFSSTFILPSEKCMIEVMDCKTLIFGGYLILAIFWQFMQKG